MAPPNRAGDDIAIRARRLIYRAGHRGTRELDLLIGSFAAAYAAAMSAPELERLERLLDEADTDLQSWLLGQERPADPDHHALIERILAHQRNALAP